MEYTVNKTSYSFRTTTHQTYTGTIEELTEQLSNYLRYRKPRTINGLSKMLNQYTNSHKTTYTGTYFEVY